MSPRIDLSRRQFIERAAALTGLATVSALRLSGQPRMSPVSRVAIVVDPSDQSARSRFAQWAIGRVRLGLEACRILKANAATRHRSAPPAYAAMAVVRSIQDFRIVMLAVGTPHCLTTPFLEHL